MHQAYLRVNLVALGATVVVHARGRTRSGVRRALRRAHTLYPTPAELSRLRLRLEQGPAEEALGELRNAPCLYPDGAAPFLALPRTEATTATWTWTGASGTLHRGRDVVSVTLRGRNPSPEDTSGWLQGVTIELAASAWRDPLLAVLRTPPRDRWERRAAKHSRRCSVGGGVNVELVIVGPGDMGHGRRRDDALLEALRALARTRRVVPLDAFGGLAHAAAPSRRSVQSLRGRLAGSREGRAVDPRTGRLALAGTTLIEVGPLIVAMAPDGAIWVPQYRLEAGALVEAFTPEGVDPELVGRIGDLPHVPITTAAPVDGHALESIALGRPVRPPADCAPTAPAEECVFDPGDPGPLGSASPRQRAGTRWAGVVADDARPAHPREAIAGRVFSGATPAGGPLTPIPVVINTLGEVVRATTL